MQRYVLDNTVFYNWFQGWNGYLFLLVEGQRSLDVKTTCNQSTGNFLSLIVYESLGFIPSENICFRNRVQTFTMTLSIVTFDKSEYQLSFCDEGRKRRDCTVRSLSRGHGIPTNHNLRRKNVRRGCHDVTPTIFTLCAGENELTDIV